MCETNGSIVPSNADCVNPLALAGDITREFEAELDQLIARHQERIRLALLIYSNYSVAYIAAEQSGHLARLERHVHAAFTAAMDRAANIEKEAQARA